MENTNLQTALNQFEIFYKNVNDLIVLNKKESKKLIGHSIFKKSDNALFNFIETTLLCAGSTVGCGALKYFGLLPYNFFLSASVACVALGTVAIISNNIIYHINNHVGGPIGRTYAKMQSDEYFVALKHFIKKDFSVLLNKNASKQQKIDKFVEFADTLSNMANNLEADYEKICKRVNKYNYKRQEKWQPILEHISKYTSYLKNNAEKFSLYADRLQEDEKDILFTFENLEDMIVSKDKQHSSEFNEFKKYLERKKMLKETLGYDMDEMIKNANTDEYSL